MISLLQIWCLITIIFIFLSFGFPCLQAAKILFKKSKKNWACLHVGSRDLSQAEKEITACKVEQIHKMTTIFTQKDNLGPF
jgi:hypothetical protein